MQLTKNFTLQEFNPRGLDITPQYAENFRMLAQNLQAIRDYLGTSITITSGLRSVAYNSSLAGASKTSQHLYGEACDFVVNRLDSDGLDYLFAKLYSLEVKLPNACSQLIRESNGKGGEWIHMGVKTERWLETSKAVIAGSDSNAAQIAKASKRLTSCEVMRTPDANTFTLVRYIPYGEFG